MEVVAGVTVGKCREKLISRYQNKICKVQMRPWDPDSMEDVKNVYSVLNIYKKDSNGRFIGEREKLFFNHSVADIFYTKVNDIPPDRIVLIAEAGKGKTTVVAKIAHDWAYRVQGSPLQNVPLLFILRFREIKRETSLGRAIVGQLLHNLPVKPDELENFIRKYQSLCWIVLDGLDEFRGRMNTNRKVTSNCGNIVSVLTNKELPDCRVLVTTRPHLEKDFDQGELPKVYAKMEIEGYSPSNRNKYIDKFFKDDPMQGRDLKIYLDENVLINELVSTPLFCTMVCYLWRENLMGEIETQTQFFDNINTFLWHHSKVRSTTYTWKWLNSIQLRLGKVAFNGLLSDSEKCEFTPTDFKDDQQAIGGGCDLGIISSSEHFGRYDPTTLQVPMKTSIVFYHRFAQEHLAGKYIAVKTDRVRTSLKLTRLDELLKTARRNLDKYKDVLRFAAGTNSEICVKVMKDILSNKYTDHDDKYRLVFDCASELSGLSKGTCSVMQGCIADGEVVLKSPTVYTAIGMKKFPEQIKKEVNLRPLI